jgi:hypothetical protein
MRGQLNWDLEVPARYRGPRERLSAGPDLDHHTLLSLPGASSRARPGELSRSDFVPWSDSADVRGTASRRLGVHWWWALAKSQRAGP